MVGAGSAARKYECRQGWLIKEIEDSDEWIGVRALEARVTEGGVITSMAVEDALQTSIDLST